MKRFLSLLCCCLLALSARAQYVEILRSANITPLNTEDKFVCLEAAPDTAGMAYVATLQVSGADKQGIPSVMFPLLRKKAQDLGGNAFLLRSFRWENDYERAELVVDVYFAQPARLAQLQAARPTNRVYVFGNQRPVGRTFHFKFNGRKRDLLPGRYFQWQLQPQQAATFNRGGFTGTTMTYQYSPDRPSAFLMIGGANIGSATREAGDNNFSVAVRTGNLSSIGPELGWLLVALLKP